MKLFDVQTGKIQIGSLVADLHVGIKGSVFEGSTLDRNLFRKEKKVTVKAVSSSLVGEWLCLNPSFYCPLFSWHSQTKGLLICVYWSLLPSHPQSDLRLFHQHCLSLKATFILGHRREKKNTSGQWNCLVTQKGVIIEINHPILFHNWTLPRLTFQWHLPSRLSYHMHSPNSSFVCQENSEPPLVGLVWQCNHK